MRESTQGQRSASTVSTESELELHIRPSGAPAADRKKHRERSARHYALATLLAAFLLSSWGVLWAPPVPVPNLSTPGFQSSDLDPYFRTAASELSESQWLAAVNDGRTVVSADWEVLVDQEIDRLVQEAKDADPTITAQEEQDLRDALVSQKQAAKTSWEASADLEIEREQETYIVDLVEQQIRDLPVVLQTTDTTGLDSYLQTAATDAYTLTDWERIVDEGSFQVSSAWEAIAIPALQQAAADQTDLAVTDGTIVSTEAQDLYEAELLALLSEDALEIFRAALANRIQPELRTFVAALGREADVDITLAAFDSANLSPYIAAAQTSATEEEWQTAVANGRDYAHSSWQVDAEYEKNMIIAALVGDSGLSGNDATVYANYLSTEIDSQIQVDSINWLAEADQLIAAEFATYQANAGGLELTTPVFDIDQYGTVYEAASFAPGEAAWEATVEAGRADARALWSANVLERMDAIMADAVAGGMSNGQQNQLRDDLEAARDLALADWDAAADAADAAQHEVFLLNLLATQTTPPLPDLAAFDPAALDPYIAAANDATSSPSVWQTMVEDGIQALFDAWRPAADPIIDTAATNAVSLAVANGLIHSARAQELAATIVMRDMQNDAHDAYVNAALTYMSDAFVDKVDDVFNGITPPALDANVMGFDPNLMSPVFSGALTAANLYDWALLIDNGKNNKRQEYFNIVSNHLVQVIDDAVATSGLTGSDASVYRSYLQHSLAGEAQAALQIWESDANALILQRRQEFLDSQTPVVATVNESGAPTINIAPLTTAAFEAAPLLTMFHEARNAVNVAQWESYVLGGLQNVAAAWNTQTNATVDALVSQYTAGVTDDTFETINLDGVSEGQGVKVNSLLAYQNYVRNFLEDQKRLQFAAWVKQAEQTIQMGRDAFLAELSAASVATQQESNSAAGELTGETTDGVQTEAQLAGDAIQGEPKSREDEARDYITRVRRQLQLDEMNWRSDWRDRRDTGVNQYNRSLALLEQNRAEYLGAMQQADLTWQTNLAMMEQFEGNVRNGLGTVTLQLQQMLAMNPMFHTDETCAADRKTSCVTSPTTGQGVPLNAAGAALKEKLDALEARLAAGEPLSTVVVEIQLALESMKTHAESRKQFWSTRIEGDDEWAKRYDWGTYEAPGSKGKYGGGVAGLDEIRQRGALFNQGGVSAGALDTKIVYKWTTYETVDTGFFGSTEVPTEHTKILGDLKNDPSTWDLTDENGNVLTVDMSALEEHREMALAIDNVRTNNRDGMADFIETETAEQRLVIQNTATGDLCGSGTTASSSSTTNVEECYSRVGDQAFVYYGQGGKHGGYTGWAPVRDVDLNLSYRWYDVNAEANWKVWDEALASVEAVANHWTNEVLPDVQAWEQQVADYRAGYEQWQIEAGIQMQQYHEAYLAGRDQLLMGRNRFIYEMDEEWRDGRSQFEQAYQTVDRIEVDWVETVAELRANGEEVDDDMLEDLEARLGAVVDAIDIEKTAIPDVAGELEAVVDTLPTLEEEFLTQFQEGIPDPALIAGIVEEFQQTATGMMNFAVLHATGDRLEEARQAYIDRMKEILESIEPPEQGDLPALPFTKYEVVVNDDGSVEGTRTIYDGTARQIDKGKGGYAMKPENYLPNMMVQEIHLQAPESGALPQIGDLFDTDLSEMMEAVSGALGSQGEALGDSSRFAVVESQISDQMDVASRNVEQYFSDMQANIAWEQNAKESDSSVINTITTVLSVVAPFCPPCAIALVAVSAVKGFQEGGLLGALTSVAGSALSALGPVPGLQLDLAYTYDEGFSGGISYGAQGGAFSAGLSFGADGLSANAGVNVGGFDLGASYGADGFGANVGYSKGGLDLGFNYNNGGFGADVGFSNDNIDLGLSYANGQFGGDLGYSKGNTNLGLSFADGQFGGDLGFSKGAYDVGLNFADGQFGADVGYSKGAYDVGLNFANGQFGGDFGYSKGAYDLGLNFADGQFGGDLNYARGDYDVGLNLLDGQLGGNLNYARGDNSLGLNYTDGQLSGDLNYTKNGLDLGLQYDTTNGFSGAVDYKLGKYGNTGLAFGPDGVEYDRLYKDLNTDAIRTDGMNFLTEKLGIPKAAIYGAGAVGVVAYCSSSEKVKSDCIEKLRDAAGNKAADWLSDELSKVPNTAVDIQYEDGKFTVDASTKQKVKNGEIDLAYNSETGFSGAINYDLGRYGQTGIAYGAEGWQTDLLYKDLNVDNIKDDALKYVTEDLGIPKNALYGAGAAGVIAYCVSSDANKAKCLDKLKDNGDKIAEALAKEISKRTESTLNLAYNNGDITADFQKTFANGKGTLDLSYSNENGFGGAVDYDAGKYGRTGIAWGPDGLDYDRLYENLNQDNIKDAALSYLTKDLGIPKGALYGAGAVGVIGYCASSKAMTEKCIEKLKSEGGPKAAEWLSKELSDRIPHTEVDLQYEDGKLSWNALSNIEGKLGTTTLEVVNGKLTNAGFNSSKEGLLDVAYNSETGFSGQASVDLGEYGKTGLAYGPDGFDTERLYKDLNQGKIKDAALSYVTKDLGIPKGVLYGAGAAGVIAYCSSSQSVMDACVTKLKEKGGPKAAEFLTKELSNRLPGTDVDVQYVDGRFDWKSSSEFTGKNGTATLEMENGKINQAGFSGQKGRVGLDLGYNKDSGFSGAVEIDAGKFGQTGLAYGPDGFDTDRLYKNLNQGNIKDAALQYVTKDLGIPKAALIGAGAAGVVAYCAQSKAISQKCVDTLKTKGGPKAAQFLSKELSGRIPHTDVDVQYVDGRFDWKSSSVIEGKFGTTTLEIENGDVKEVDFQAQLPKLKESIANLGGRSQALQKVVGSMAAESGSGAATMLKRATAGLDTSKMSDSEIMERAFVERAKVNKYLGGASRGVKAQMQARLLKEKQKALNRL
ncbi:MAG: TIGR04388 family protein [Leptospirales bacterium]|jgi:hypothetical protein